MNTISKDEANVLLAAWLAENYPAIFNQLSARVSQEVPQPLQGFSDVLRSIGTGIGTAVKAVTSTLSTGVKAVGSFLSSTDGQATLASLATAYGALNAATIQTQQIRADAGQAPAIIETRFDPSTQSYVPIYSPDGKSGYTVNGAVLSDLTPSFLKRYWLPLTITAGGILVLYFFFGRRK